MVLLHTHIKMNNFLHFNQKPTAFLWFIYKCCILKIIMIKFTHKKQIMRLILKYLNVKEGEYY